MGIHFTVQTPKELDELIKSFDKPEKEIRDAARGPMMEAGKMIASGWQGVAAVDTGRYKGNIHDEIIEIPGVLLQAKVSTNVTSPQGFPYPRALEDSERYHYRSTQRVGQKTAGKIVEMFKGMRDELNKLSGQAIENIFRLFKG